MNRDFADLDLLGESRHGELSLVARQQAFGGGKCVDQKIVGHQFRVREAAIGPRQQGGQGPLGVLLIKRCRLVQRRGTSLAVHDDGSGLTGAAQGEHRNQQGQRRDQHKQQEQGVTAE